MFFPKKSIFRHVDSGFQSALMVMIWCGSFGGKFLNLYYDFRWWDVILHFVGGGACVTVMAHLRELAEEFPQVVPILNTHMEVVKYV